MAKVLVSIPGEFLAEIDRLASEESRSRSELLREAARLYLQTHRTSKRPADDPRVQRAIAVQNALSYVAPGTGEDSTAEIRRWREARR